jgi:hypothetical protein
MHDREGSPEVGLLAALLPDGRRAWGATQETDVVKAMVDEELAGRTVELRPDGSFTLP